LRTERLIFIALTTIGSGSEFLGERSLSYMHPPFACSENEIRAGYAHMEARRELMTADPWK
jgi:hypothetical protein